MNPAQTKLVLIVIDAHPVGALIIGAVDSGDSADLSEDEDGRVALAGGGFSNRDIGCRLHRGELGEVGSRIGAAPQAVAQWQQHVTFVAKDGARRASARGGCRAPQTVRRSAIGADVHLRSVVDVKLVAVHPIRHRYAGRRRTAGRGSPRRAIVGGIIRAVSYTHLT